MEKKLKYCPDCKEEKDIDLFGKETSNKDGLRSICKKCNSVRTLEWIHKNTDRINTRERALYAKDPSKKKEKSKKWYRDNPEKAIAKNKRAWKNRDVEGNRERQREWGQKNKDRKNATSRKTYSNNKESRKLSQKQWEQENKGKRRAIVAKRRAIKIRATPKWFTKEDFNKIESFYLLAQKMTEETGIKYEVDHIIPLNSEMVSGFHHWNNLQILTAEQNRSKGNKIMFEIIGIFPVSFGPK